MNIRKILKPIRKTFKCYNTLINNTFKLVNPRPYETIKTETILQKNNITYTLKAYSRNNEIIYEYTINNQVF